MRATTTNNFARLNIGIDYGVNAIELDTILGQKTSHKFWSSHSQVPVKPRIKFRSNIGMLFVTVPSVGRGACGPPGLGTITHRYFS